MTNIQISLNTDNYQAIKDLLASKGITISSSAKKNTGKLNMIDDHTAECHYCHTQFDINEIDDDSFKELRKTGLCPECQAKLNNLTQSIKTKTVSNVKSAGSQIRDLVFSVLDKFDKTLMKKFTDREFCHDNFGILYPLFIDISKVKDEDINELRLAGTKGYRFATKRYTILKKTYLMCNDLYSRNVAKFENTFMELGLIEDTRVKEEEIIEETPIIEEKPKKRKAKVSKLEVIDFTK